MLEGPHSLAHWFLLAFIELLPASLAESSRDCLRLISWFICLDHPEHWRENWTRGGFSAIMLLTQEIRLSSSRCSGFCSCFCFCCMSFINDERLQLDLALFISAFTSSLYGFSLIFMRAAAKIHRKPWNSSAVHSVLMRRRIKADLISTGLDKNCSYMKRIAFKHAQLLLGLWN